MLITDNLQNQEVKVTDYGLVSVIMPNYNSEKYVEATIKSVLDQTYQNWELLFVDDCSQDQSLEIVKSFEEKRIKILSTEKNRGAAVARNVAIKEAKGKWIAFLDSDDIWLPDKLEKQITYMQKNDISFCHTDYEVVDKNGNTVSVYKPRIDVCKYKDTLKHNHIGCLTVIYNSDKLGKVFMPTDAIKREDMACWLNILKNGEQAYCLHECLAKYKVHSKSVSSNKFKMMKYQWNLYRNVERLSPLRCTYYITNWAILGLLKYR